MKKKILRFGIFLMVGAILVGGFGANASAMSEKRVEDVKGQCETIINNLKQVQKRDAQTRVYFGGYYETILTKFITPMNMRLVENNLSTTDFVESQNNYVARRTNFTNDYISYQKSLEELIAIDCKKEPERFYEKLTVTRSGREKVSSDIKKMRELIDKYTGLVKGVAEKM